MNKSVYYLVSVLFFILNQGIIVYLSTRLDVDTSDVIICLYIFILVSNMVICSRYSHFFHWQSFVFSIMICVSTFEDSDDINVIELSLSLVYMQFAAFIYYCSYNSKLLDNYDVIP